ncbi:hypothetical protein KIKIMORA_04950 [Brevundimonas phage vB_BpoS-Kikimora]|uniref:Uncharacterized protein n=1 Tax=Brevundimonas phage vB_BpoS-Kikimora TaxID=2948601 RepID=A0A9E7MSG7_9CAUD|nr:hypothetical protein KIKIMORA_04950 [Brevundimonas phage vB_BpoS-Kikimora]
MPKTIKRRKELEFTVKVTVPAWMNRAQARREVKTLLNDQCNYLMSNPANFMQEVTEKSIRAKAIR